MKEWKRLVLSPEMLLRDAISKVDEGGQQIALVTDAEGRLLGTLADGDIRRAVLAGTSLDTACGLVMNPRPTSADPAAGKDAFLKTMRRGSFHQLPLVDAGGCLVGLVTIDELIGAEPRDNWVVLMAGGLGSRLYPLTADCPKPLLKIGGAPILENILMGLAGQGFNKFFIAVNYKAEMIVEYFGDGSKWGVDIRYLHEHDRMGTAGALSLLPEQPDAPILVMNGDLLTQADFAAMLDFHDEQNTAATMAVREFEYQIPYGVVDVENARISKIEEKPTHKFLVAAGIYVLAPDSISCIPKGTFFDMPNLFRSLAESGRHTSAYHFKDYWLDIGRLEEFERAQREWVVGGTP